MGGDQQRSLEGEGILVVRLDEHVAVVDELALSLVVVVGVVHTYEAAGSLGPVGQPDRPTGMTYALWFMKALSRALLSAGLAAQSGASNCAPSDDSWRTAAPSRWSDRAGSR